MAKAIKFNLVLGEQPIRMIADLQSHFDAGELLKCYKSGTLRRWLSSRGYEEQLKKLDAVSDADDESILLGLCDVFAVKMDEQEIKQCIAERNLPQEEDGSDSESADTDENAAAEDQQNSYQDLLQILYNDPSDLVQIRSTVKLLNDEHFDELKADGEELLQRLWDVSPYIVFCFLMYENTRKLVEDTSPKKNTSAVLRFMRRTQNNSFFEAYLSTIWAKIENVVSSQESAINALGDAVELYDVSQMYDVSQYDSSDGYRVVVPAGQKCLILSTGLWTRIREVGQVGPVYSLGSPYLVDIGDDERFPILNGFEYKVRSACDEKFEGAILYLEV